MNSTFTKFVLTGDDAQEVQHKLWTLASTEDLLDDYGITEEQATKLAESVPIGGGEWSVPAFMLEAVRGEMADHCIVLGHVARDARSGGEVGQALRIAKQAIRLARIFETTK